VSVRCHVQMLKGPEGTSVSVQTDGGSVSVIRDSNCSLGPASQGPTLGGAPNGAMPMPMSGGPGMGVPGMQFNSVPGQIMSPQECAALGVPPGTKWGGAGGKAEVSAYNGFGGGGVSESFLSI